MAKAPRRPLPVVPVGDPPQAPVKRPPPSAVQKNIVALIVEYGRDHDIPGGYVVLGVMEFLALMIQTNFVGRPAQADEVDRLFRYVHERLDELRAAAERGTKEVDARKKRRRNKVDR
jgi:hypothetical protein